jgi:hypothetical protein
MNNQSCATPPRLALHPVHFHRSHAPALAATLDRLADFELQAAHHATAENLSRQAAMREAAR